MLFYSLLIASLIGLSVVEYIGTEKKFNKVLLISIKILPFVILYFLNTFKAITVGYDAVAYYDWYNQLLNGLKPTGSYPSVEIGFKVFIELFAKTKAPYLVFYALSNAIVYGTTGFAIIKLSRNSSFSALIYCCLSVMVLNFSALRQSIALGMAFLSLIFLIKKKWWSYLLFAALVILGGLFHRSAYAFLICLPLSFIKIKPSYLFYITPFIVMFFIVTPSLFQSIYYLTGSTMYMPTYRDGVGEYYFIFFLLFFVFVLLSTKNKITTWIFTGIEFLKVRCFKKSHQLDVDVYQPEVDLDTKKYLVLFLAGVLFQATSRVNYAAPRLATQFLMLCSLFVPNTLIQIKNLKFKIFMFTITCLAFYAFFVYDSILPNYLGIVPYDFIWN